MVTMNVCLLSGRAITLFPHLNDPIWIIKCMVAMQEGLNPSQVRVVFEWKVIWNHFERLTCCGIKKKSFVQIVIVEPEIYDV